MNLIMNNYFNIVDNYQILKNYIVY